MALLAPVSLFGLVLFAAVAVASTLPPVYAIFALMNGRYLLAPIIVAAWVLWLRYGGPARRFVSEGFEHASL
jgi:hypothetical protein